MIRTYTKMLREFVFGSSYMGGGGGIDAASVFSRGMSFGKKTPNASIAKAKDKIAGNFKGNSSKKRAKIGKTGKTGKIGASPSGKNPASQPSSSAIRTAVGANRSPGRLR